MLTSEPRPLRTVPEHTDYEKFIIVCPPRSGSNLLVSYLDSHPGIRCYAEIFHAGETNMESAMIYPKTSDLHQRFLDASAAFLETHFFVKPYPKEIVSLGFKLLYNQALGEKGRQVWSYLVNATAIKIIHLRRSNLLAGLLSCKRALQTGAWTSLDKQYGVGEEPIELSYEECLWYFQAIEMYVKVNGLRFKQHRRIDVWYEDLVRDNAGEMQRILDFLGLPCVDLRTVFRKQSTRALGDGIKNYQALKQQFSETRYAAFFETADGSDNPAPSQPPVR